MNQKSILNLINLTSKKSNDKFNTLFSSNIDNSSKDKTFDAIRGIAVLLVLFTHLDNYRILYIWPFSSQPIQGAIGQCGVFLFFILSGYLIWSSASKQLIKKNGLSAYFVNRFTRIYPLYATCIIFIIIFQSYFIGYKKPDLSLDVLIRHAFFLQSFTPNISASLNGPFWTLTHEVIFYLLVPLIFKIKNLNAVLVFSLISTQVAWHFYAQHLHHFLNYWPLFAIGIYTCKTKLAIKTAFCTIIIFACLVLYIKSPANIINQMIMAVAIFHLMLNYQFKSIIFKPIVGLGVISYSLYVWHYVLIHLGTPYIIKYITPQIKNFNLLIPKFKPWLPNGFYIEALLIIFFIVLFSTASYLIIEKPFMTAIRKKILAKLAY